MKTLTVDVAVIGAGSAGMTAWRAARSHGKRTLLIEGGPYGTTCARVGCMPSKLLIAAAEAAHAVVLAPSFGMQVAPARIDGKAVMARVRSERDRFVGFVLDSVERIPAEDRLRGHARFIDAHHLQVDDHTVVTAERIVIATGSSPSRPELLQGIGDRLLVNDDVFYWEDLPESVAVVGAGVIGLELGQALHRLGVRVTIFGRSDSLGQLTDPAVLKTAAEALAAELDLRQMTEVLAVQRDGDRVVLHSRSIDATGAQSAERADAYAYVLAATGRMPNVVDLGLEHTGLVLDTSGVPLHDPHTMQCGDSAIFIAGDISEERPVLHEATDQGRIAGDNAARYPNVQPGLRRTALTIAFTDPQVATIGQTYRTLQGGKFAIGEVSFANQGRSRVMLQNCGLLRVYAEYGSGRLLGAEMFGPRAEHMAHLLAWAHQAGMTIEQMLAMPFYHPVIEEGLRTALRDAKEKLLQGLPEIEHCADCTPGV